MIKDKKGIPIIKGDVLKVFHFVGRRNKKYYMYKYVLSTNEPNNFYKIAHLSSKSSELGKSFYYLKDENQIEDNYEIVQGYCEKQLGKNYTESIFIEDRLKNLDFIKEYLKEGEMLTGKEKIKKLNNNDICNYIGNSLCGLGAKSVGIKEAIIDNIIHRALLVRYNDNWNFVIDFDNRVSDWSIDLVRDYAIEIRKRKLGEK